MINHKYKCIFIHIPRCAGSSVELAIDGRDWWNVDISQKHMTAESCKKLYKDYWDEYFKFSFVRNPWSMEVSWYYWKKNFLKEISFKNFITDEKLNKIVKLSSGLDDGKFINIFPNLTNCYDYLTCEDKINLDFVGKVENLKEDLKFVCKKLNIPSINIPYINKTNHGIYNDYYDEKTKNIVRERYLKDIEHFDYQF